MVRNKNGLGGSEEKGNMREVGKGRGDNTL